MRNLTLINDGCDRIHSLSGSTYETIETLLISLLKYILTFPDKEKAVEMVCRQSKYYLITPSPKKW